MNHRPRCFNQSRSGQTRSGVSEGGMEASFDPLLVAISRWCHVQVIHGRESFVALAEGLHNALAACGGVPWEHRTEIFSRAGYTRFKRELCACLNLV